MPGGVNETSLWIAPLGQRRMSMSNFSSEFKGREEEIAWLKARIADQEAILAAAPIGALNTQHGCSLDGERELLAILRRRLELVVNKPKLAAIYDASSAQLNADIGWDL
jgi:hypothetical protein